jgi:sorbitol-6-phosphate 2-dehydrogenase
LVIQPSEYNDSAALANSRLASARSGAAAKSLVRFDRRCQIRYPAFRQEVLDSRAYDNHLHGSSRTAHGACQTLNNWLWASVTRRSTQGVQNMRALEDRIALVTGGAQGLGEAICHRLAREGAHVTVADLNLTSAEKVAADIKSHTDRRAIAVKVDVTDEALVEAMVHRTIQAFGRLDILVSNAGVLIADAVDQFAAEKWRTVMNVNLFGYFLCAKHAARVMQVQRSGVILQVNSKSGKKGSYKNSAYAASKFGGIGLTQSMALELAEYGVRVNSVCPGNLLDSPLWVDSLYKQYSKRWGISEQEVRQRYIDQVPMKRGCTYDDVTNVLVFLASDQASYMTRQAIKVTGGQEMH